MLIRLSNNALLDGFRKQAVQLPDEKHPEQNLGINRRPARVAVQMFDLIPNETKVNMPVDQPQQMILWNDLLHPYIVEYGFSSWFFA